MSAAAHMKPVINVAVAVVQRADGDVLLAQRPRGTVSEGYWEFPGGKFEIAEDARHALARELREETGVDIKTAYPWMTYEHEYPDKFVRLHVFRVTAWSGVPHGLEGQRISWENPAAPEVDPLLPANDIAMRALSLPPVYAITQASKYGVTAFMERMHKALDAGVRLIQVREKAMTPSQLTQFACRVVMLARRYDARVLVNGDLGAARRAGADGVHLSSEHLMRLQAPPPVNFWAASCHNAEELQRAAELRANFVGLSQVLPTASHPGVPGIGWQEFQRLTQDYPLPVYALGGMTLANLEDAMNHGAHGISLLSGIW